MQFDWLTEVGLITMIVMVPTSRPQKCLNMRHLEMIISTRKQFGKEREVIVKSPAKERFESIGKTLKVDTVLDITECN